MAQPTFLYGGIYRWFLNVYASSKLFYLAFVIQLIYS